MNIRKLAKQNWDSLVLIGLTIIFFFLPWPDVKLVLGSLIFFYLGSLIFFRKGSYAIVNHVAGYYLGITLFSLGAVGVLTAFLLPFHPNIFITSFILILFTAILVIYFGGPRSRIKSLYYGLFIVPTAFIIFTIFQEIYRVAFLPTFSPYTGLIFFLVLLALIVLTQLFYWPFHLVKNRTQRKIVNYINKWNVFLLFFLLLCGAVYVCSKWGSEATLGDKFWLILSTAAPLGTLLTLTGRFICRCMEKK